MRRNSATAPATIAMYEARNRRLAPRTRTYLTDATSLVLCSWCSVRSWSMVRPWSGVLGPRTQDRGPWTDGLRTLDGRSTKDQEPRPLVQRPLRERGDVFHEQPIARDDRLRPRRAVGHRVGPDGLEALRSASRHHQVRIVLEDEQEIARANDRGVGRLPRCAGPQRLAGLRVEREELPAVSMRKRYQRVVDE